MGVACRIILSSVCYLLFYVSVAVSVPVDIYFLYGEIRLVIDILIYIYVLEEDGIGRESALVYLYVWIACFTLRRPVPIFGPGGLLSVK